MSTFTINAPEENGYEVTAFEFKNIGDTILTRYFEKTPFVPNDKNDRNRRCDEILNIQAKGLKKRLEMCIRDSTKRKTGSIGMLMMC